MDAESIVTIENEQAKASQYTVALHSAVTGHCECQFCSRVYLKILPNIGCTVRVIIFFIDQLNK